MRFLFPFLPLGVAALQTGTCDYSKNNWYTGESYCINPKETATVEFTWSPLFSKGAKFVYAGDDLDGEEIAELEPLLDADAVKDWKGSMVGWWLEYDSASLNNSDFLMLTEMSVFYTNTTNEIGGGSHGCEELLTATCIKNINSTLRDLWADPSLYGGPPLSNLADNAGSTLIESCPEDLFIGWDGLAPRMDTLNQVTDFNAMLLASEAPSNVSIFSQHNEDAILPSGNKSFTYSRTIWDQRPFDSQQRKTAVAILMRYPAVDTETNGQLRNATKNDIGIELVCTKLKESSSSSDDDSSDSSGDSSSDDEDAAGFVRVPTGILFGTILGVFYILS